MVESDGGEYRVSKNEVSVGAVNLKYEFPKVM